MSQDDEPQRLIGRFYEAACEPGLWSAVLAEFSSWCGAFGTQFMLWDGAANRLAFTTISGYSPEAEALYGTHYGALDPRRKSLSDRPVGQFTLCQEHFDDDFVRRSAFYNEFLMPVGGRYLMATRLAEEDGMTAILGIHRNARQDGFAYADIARVRPLTSHLMRAARLTQKFLLLRERASRLEAALDRVGWSIIVTNAGGRILHLNAAAETLLAVGDGLLSAGGVLTASGAADAARLARLIAAAATDATPTLGAEAGFDPATGHLLARPSGRDALSFLVARLARSASSELGLPEPAALVFVTDPEAAGRTAIGFLRSLYGLTAAEAAVATALAGGRSGKDIAATQGKSRNTVRVQMQAALDKTGAASQADLVRIILSLPAIGTDAPPRS